MKEGELFSLVWPHYFVGKIQLMSNDAKSIIRSKIAESLDWDGYTLGLSKDVFELSLNIIYPLLFNAAPDACVDSCENYCFVWIQNIWKVIYRNPDYPNLIQ